MSHTRIPIGELLRTIFGGEAHILAPPLAEWMVASPRFAAFVETYRDKIRKKVRGMRDAEGLRDLQLELETAYLLLQAHQLTVAYEPYGTGKARGPDFAVTYTTSVTFNVEVTRMRVSSRERSKEQPDDLADGGADAPFVAQHEAARLADIVCGKLGQMLAGMINVLVVVPESNAALGIDVGGAMLQLRQRAERKDPGLFARYGFQDASDFFKRYERLSGVLVRGASERAPRISPILWENNRASHPIPARIRSILQDR
jgi:hypothetical protein